MVITVASGKGGTGKTTIAVNLATSISRAKSGHTNRQIWLADCDVEAPNAALFLNPQIELQRPVKRMIPIILEEKCNGCGRCAEVCAYNAIAIAGGKAIVFKELCHACGSCAFQCPQDAITEIPESIGLIRSGLSGQLNFTEGILEIGFSSPVPVIRDLKKRVTSQAGNGTLIIRDASPGISCPVVESLRGSYFALLVTEPTPFGLHDLKLVIQLVRQNFNLPNGVVINKSDGLDEIISKYCDENEIPILMRIPLSRKIAKIYSRGDLLIDAMPEYQSQFIQLMETIEEMINRKMVEH